MARIAEVYLIELVEYDKEYTYKSKTFDTILYDNKDEAINFCKEYNKDIDSSAIKYVRAYYSKAKVYPNY